MLDRATRAALHEARSSHLPSDRLRIPPIPPARSGATSACRARNQGADDASVSRSLTPVPDIPSGRLAVSNSKSERSGKRFRRRAYVWRSSTAGKSSRLRSRADERAFVLSERVDHRLHQRGFGAEPVADSVGRQDPSPDAVHEATDDRRRHHIAGEAVLLGDYEHASALRRLGGDRCRETAPHCRGCGLSVLQHEERRLRRGVRQLPGSRPGRVSPQPPGPKRSSSGIRGRACSRSASQRSTRCSSEGPTPGAR